MKFLILCQTEQGSKYRSKSDREAKIFSRKIAKQKFFSFVRSEAKNVSKLRKIANKFEIAKKIFDL
jgi:hypothetical protein